jgi:hypothetical protein
MRWFGIFPGEGRHRKWTLAEKMALIAELASSVS